MLAVAEKLIMASPSIYSQVCPEESKTYFLIDSMIRSKPRASDVVDRGNPQQSHHGLDSERLVESPFLTRAKEENYVTRQSHNEARLIQRQLFSCKI